MSKTKSFEDNIKQLEQIVKDLEHGELPLQEALKEFENGIKIYGACKEILTDVEDKIKIIEEDLENGKFISVPFSNEGE